jgi:uncharacterized BrkB/YihY/UPF0761 family membrane protein
MVSRMASLRILLRGTKSMKWRKSLQRVKRRNVYREALATAAVMTAFAVLGHYVLSYAQYAFGAAGAMVTILTWMTGLLVIAGGGGVFTYQMLVRRGIAVPNVVSLQEFCAARQAAAENPPPR